MFLEIFMLLLFAIIVIAIFIYGVRKMQLSGKVILLGLLFGTIGVILFFTLIWPLGKGLGHYMSCHDVLCK